MEPLLPTPATGAAASDRNEQFVVLLQGAQRRLQAYLATLLGNRHDAEDALQRVSIILWRKFADFELGSDFLAWAITVARFEARNFQRVSGRSRLRFGDDLMELLAEERAPDLLLLDNRLDALDECLRELDPPSRSLLESAYQQDSTIADLAARLGKAPQTLYNRLNTLRRSLVACIEHRIGEPA